MTLLKDRREAGRLLAASCGAYAEQEDVVVLATPPGGVPVAYEIADVLRTPLDVLCVRNLRAPGMRDAIIGTVTTGGKRMVNEDIVRLLGVSRFAIDSVVAEEQARLEQIEGLYRDGWPPLPVGGRTALLVTDGIATGVTMKAAIASLRKRGAARVVVCTPVASREGFDLVEALTDEVICLDTPEPFISVIRWYEDGSPPGDEECAALLRKSSIALCAPSTPRSVH